MHFPCNYPMEFRNMKCNKLLLKLKDDHLFNQWNASTILTISCKVYTFNICKKTLQKVLLKRVKSNGTQFGYSQKRIVLPVTATRFEQGKDKTRIVHNKIWTFRIQFSVI